MTKTHATLAMGALLCLGAATAVAQPEPTKPKRVRKTKGGEEA